MTIRIQDESGDKKYFTIIPNYVLNHSTAIAQALYLQLKRLAGESGTAYPSRGYLMDKLNISKPTLLKEFNYLLEKKWIKYIGEVEVETKGGKQKTKEYKIIDLWKYNSDFYNKGVKNNTPPNIKGVKNNTPKGVKQGGKKYTHKEELLNKNHIQEEHIISTIVDSEQSSQEIEYIPEYQDKTLNKQIIGIMMIFKKINPTLNMGHKTQRIAVKNLINQFGYEKVKQWTNFAVSIQGKPYAPTITTPYNLFTKLANLKIYYQQQSQTMGNSILDLDAIK